VIPPNCTRQAARKIANNILCYASGNEDGRLGRKGVRPLYQCRIARIDEHVIRELWRCMCPGKVRELEKDIRPGGKTPLLGRRPDCLALRKVGARDTVPRKELLHRRRLRATLQKQIRAAKRTDATEELLGVTDATKFPVRPSPQCQGSGASHVACVHQRKVGPTPGISCERPICSTLVCFIPLFGGSSHSPPTWPLTLSISKLRDSRLHQLAN
jgi:hypothetical protein